MMDKISKISNPLTIIAIFAGLAEIASTTALGLLNENAQMTFIWFVMLFPTLLVILFFGTLIFKDGVLYGPGDFKDDETYLRAKKDQKDQIKNDLRKLDEFRDEISQLVDELKGENEKGIKESNKEVLDKINELTKSMEVKIKETNNTIEWIHKPSDLIEIKYPTLYQHFKDSDFIKCKHHSGGMSDVDISLRNELYYIFGENSKGITLNAIQSHFKRDGIHLNDNDIINIIQSMEDDGKVIKVKQGTKFIYKFKTNT